MLPRKPGRAKSVRKKNVNHPPEPTPLLSLDGRDYYPELATNWLPATPAADGVSFDIRLDDLERRGPIIATITVNPGFKEADRRKIAWLMSCAPDLWQRLLSSAFALLDGLDFLKDFAAVHESLFFAAGRNPFNAYPLASKDEDQVMLKNNQDITSRLTVPNGGQQL